MAFIRRNKTSAPAKHISKNSLNQSRRQRVRADRRTITCFRLQLPLLTFAVIKLPTVCKLAYFMHNFLCSNICEFVLMKSKTYVQKVQVPHVSTILLTEVISVIFFVVESFHSCFREPHPSLCVNCNKTI